jgi:hypothetical protein
MLLLTIAAVSLAHAADAPVRGSPRSHPHEHMTLEGRVTTYARSLGLDSNQQMRLRALLMWQRDQVQRIWNDTTLTAAMQIHATSAIGDATADRIRAILTEEQRMRYNPPRPPRDSVAQAAAPDVESWMKATK